MDIESGISLETKIAVAKQYHEKKKIFLGCLKGPDTDKGVTETPVPLVDIAALIGFCVASFAMVSSGAVLVDINGGMILLFSPYVVVQKRILKKLGTFRSLHNSLRNKVNELMVQNDKLTKEINRLEGSVTELEQVEKELSLIANTENVDRLVYVVAETKRINEKMKKNTQAKIVQQLITTVLRTDRDLDLKIGPRELRNLMIRLDNQNGFEFHKDRFMDALGGNPDESVPVEKIMAVIRNLKDDSLDETSNIFVLNTGITSTSPDESPSSPGKIKKRFSFTSRKAEGISV